MIEKVKTLIVGYFLLPDFKSRGHPKQWSVGRDGSFWEGPSPYSSSSNLKVFCRSYGDPTGTALTRCYLTFEESRAWNKTNPFSRRWRFTIRICIFERTLERANFYSFWSTVYPIYKISNRFGYDRVSFYRVTTLSQFGTPKSVSVRLSHNCVTNSYLCLR